MLLWCFSLSCTECRLRRCRLLFARKTCLKQGPRMLKLKNELLSYAVGDWQIRGLRALVRKQVYLMATDSYFLSPSYFYFLVQQLPSWTLWYVFLKWNFRRFPGSNQGPLGLQPNALPLSYIPLNIVNRQSTLSVRVYIKPVRKRSFLLLLWFFSLSCSENRPRVLKFFFHS